MADIKCIVPDSSILIESKNTALQLNAHYVHYSRKITSVAIKYQTLTWYFCKKYHQNKSCAVKNGNKANHSRVQYRKQQAKRANSRTKCHVSAFWATFQPRVANSALLPIFWLRTVCSWPRQKEPPNLKRTYSHTCNISWDILENTNEWNSRLKEGCKRERGRLN